MRVVQVRQDRSTDRAFPVPDGLVAEIWKSILEFFQEVGHKAILQGVHSPRGWSRQGLEYDPHCRVAVDITQPDLKPCNKIRQRVPAYDLARFYAMLGDKARAIDYLEASVDEHRQFALSAKVHIIFRDFQDEPRYHAILRHFKLE